MTWKHLIDPCRVESTAHEGNSAKGAYFLRILLGEFASSQGERGLDFYDHADTKVTLTVQHGTGRLQIRYYGLVWEPTEAQVFNDKKQPIDNPVTGADILLLLRRFAKEAKGQILAFTEKEEAGKQFNISFCHIGDGMQFGSGEL